MTLDYCALYRYSYLLIYLLYLDEKKNRLKGSCLELAYVYCIFVCCTYYIISKWNKFLNVLWQKQNQ